MAIPFSIEVNGFVRFAPIRIKKLYLANKQKSLLGNESKNEFRGK